MPVPRSHDLACVIHVHSTFSDGTGTVEEIVAAAGRAEADVVMLTDHDSLGARHAGWEGWHGSVLLLVGEEVTPPGGHYLAFGHDREIEHRGRSQREVARAASEHGALGFPAHPFSEGARLSKRIGRPHGWQDLDADEHVGVELWSLLTDSAEAWAGLREAARFLRGPERAIADPPARNVEAWDRLCERRRVVAIGGLDQHQEGFRLRGRVVSPFPNERIFRLLRTHVLCERPPSGTGPEDRDLVYSALREGRCYLAMDGLAPARGFKFWAEGPDGAVEMGDQARPGEWTLIAESPHTAELRLLRDGRELERVTAERLTAPALEPGAYRVEAHLPLNGRSRTWVITNPIYLRD